MNTNIYGDFQVCISVPWKMLKNGQSYFKNLEVRNIFEKVETIMSPESLILLY